jgi:hypothetical protein
LGPAILTLKLGEKSIERASATCRENSSNNKHNKIPLPYSSLYVKAKQHLIRLAVIGRRRRINEGNDFYFLYIS